MDRIKVILREVGGSLWPPRSLLITVTVAAFWLFIIGGCLLARPHGPAPPGDDNCRNAPADLC